MMKASLHAGRMGKPSLKVCNWDSPFRPRRWKGALLPHTAKVTFDNLDPGKRPLAATADFMEVFGVSSITIAESALNRVTLLFDPDRSLEERVIGEQFAL